MLPGSIQMFEADTAQSMFDFQANNVIGQIAPRPVLLLHSSDDHVTPVEQSIELFEHANQPAEMHLFADTDHFMFAEGNTRVHAVVQNWLAQYFPVSASRRRRVATTSPTVILGGPAKGTAPRTNAGLSPLVRALDLRLAPQVTDRRRRLTLFLFCSYVIKPAGARCPPSLPSRTPRSRRSPTG